ncbi:peptidoglycan editing factor PgeF [Geobacter sp.]|uniref:peptidoglycan editing factor PgeF n=1 Tax=Geobacter sp. TaxID=46610 RepID=UPI0026090B54|nr:peptidoglycan editing factor PgeF [Geobacter sp.]
MEMKRSDKVHYLEPALFTAAGVSAHGFTTRHEGVSRPPYNSLNLGANTLDSSHAVEGNRSILARGFGADVERLVTVTQVHGVDLLVIDSPNPDYSYFQKLEADGIITNQPGVMIGVCVADCVPVLLLDPVKRVAAALHAGWKGTAAGICRKGIDAFIDLFGSDPRDILAAVGPGIGPCCYEVDTPVAEAFRRGGHAWEEVATIRGVARWRLDLAKANARQLAEAGVPERNIETSGQCVSCAPELFFSYRRDGGETGRQMGFIMLKP